MWDLSIVKSFKGGAKVKSARRASLTGMSTQGSDTGRVSCVGKVKYIFIIIIFVTGRYIFQAKPNSSISPSVGKFTNLVGLENPHFPVGTFAVCSKSNTIGKQVYPLQLLIVL